MKHSEHINELAAALAKAQGQFGPIARAKTVMIRTKDRGAYEFAYAPLDIIMSAVRKPLSDNGLSVLQNSTGEQTTTLLMHASGQWIESDPLRMPAGGDAKSVGSAITYARRYQLSAFLGLVSEDDDDGEGGNGNGGNGGNGAHAGNGAEPAAARTPAQPKPAEPGKPATTGKPVTPGALNMIRARLQVKAKEESALLAHFGLAKLEDADMGAINDVLAWVAA